MNRRELLKGIAALPFVAVLAGKVPGVEAEEAEAVMAIDTAREDAEFVHLRKDIADRMWKDYTEAFRSMTIDELKKRPRHDWMPHFTTD